MSTHSKGKASEMKHYAGKAVFSAAVGHALDGLDLMILSFALSGIMATFAVDNTTAGMLTSITLAGAFLGGLIFGKLADKYGRIKVLTYSVIFFGVFTLGSAFAPNFEVMALCRFLAGCLQDQRVGENVPYPEFQDPALTDAEQIARPP